jgi:predicted exporter
MFMARAIQSDPLGINMTILGRMEKLSTSMGYDVTLENGHFISRDGCHTMLLLETTVPLTDAAGARRLLDFLESKIAQMPAGVKASLVCGHTHVVSNEETIKRDLGVVMGLASIAFIALYVMFFRDLRALLIFVIPAMAAMVALAITALMFPRLSYFVIAFGPVIAGIADDYGIAVYVAIRHGVKRVEAVRHVVAPVTAGCVTTAGIFFAFFFSRIPGYYQLAWFCILSLLLTLVLALFVLPLFLRPGKTPEDYDNAPSFVPPKHPRMCLTAIALVFVVAGALAVRVRFDSDVTRLDGTNPAILQAETEFKRVWGTGERKEAMLVVMGDSYESVMEKTDALYEQAAASVGATQIVSLASVWPSAKTRAMRVKAWTEFWQNGREAKLRNLLAEAGAARGFTTNAFEPFLGHLYDQSGVVAEPVTNRMLDNLKDRFVQKPNGLHQTISYFPDKPELVTALSQAVGTRQDASVISRTVLGDILSNSFTGEVVKISVLAGLMIILMSWAFIRDLSMTWVALSPAFTAVVGLLGFMGAVGRPLSIANLISGIIVFGLSIDFGMHILHACRHPQGAHARVAVTFAAMTTVMGAMALLFAHHPALFSVGLTLTIGVGLGYVAAMWMVPVLYEVFVRRGK